MIISPLQMWGPVTFAPFPHPSSNSEILIQSTLLNGKVRISQYRPAAKHLNLDSAHEIATIISLFCLRYPRGMFSIHTKF